MRKRNLDNWARFCKPVRQNLDCRKDSIQRKPSNCKQSHYKAADPNTVGSAFHMPSELSDCPCSSSSHPSKAIHSLLRPFLHCHHKLIIDELASKQKVGHIRRNSPQAMYQAQMFLAEMSASKACTLPSPPTSFGPR